MKEGRKEEGSHIIKEGTTEGPMEGGNNGRNNERKEGRRKEAI